MWSIANNSCSPKHGGIQSWQAIYAKSAEKNTLEHM
jgi:hypothetical protein